MDNNEHSILILENPGCFPSLLDSHEVNGGIPQNGSIGIHLQKLKTYIKNYIPNQDYNGHAIINMDRWGSTWQQNIGKYFIYQQESLKLVKSRKRGDATINIDKVAATEFNAAAKEFVLESLVVAKMVRPKAQWGFSGFPTCNQFTYNGSYCSEDHDSERDILKESNALHPSFHLNKLTSSSNDRNEFVSSCIEECIHKNLTCIPLVYFKYNDHNLFLSKQDLETVITEIKRYNLPGVVIWAKTKDLQSKEECEDFQLYLSQILGPVVKNITSS